MARTPVSSASLLEREDEAPSLTADFLIGSAPRLSGQPARRGRPPAAEPKPKVTIRLPQKTLEALRQSGRGWQTRLAQLAGEMVAAEKAANTDVEAEVGTSAADRKREAQ